MRYELADACQLEIRNYELQLTTQQRRHFDQAREERAGAWRNPLPNARRLQRRPEGAKRE